MRYRLKIPPHYLVDAIRWNGQNLDGMRHFFGNSGMAEIDANNCIIVRTPSGDDAACPGTWILRYSPTHFEVCDPGIFEESYELIGE
jgi:hypothetical protein